MLSCRRRFLFVVALTVSAGAAQQGIAQATAAPWSDKSPHRIRRIIVDRGVTLEVLDWGGSGTPLVFLAGYGNSAHVFDAFAPQFTNSYHVYGITRRGFGTSTLTSTGYDNATLVRNVIAVLDSLKITQPILIAHSFGGTELNGIAIAHPGLARGLIYLDAGFDFADLYGDSLWVNMPIPRPPYPPHFDNSAAASTAYVEEMLGPGYPESEVRSAAAWSEAGSRAPGFHADSLPTWLMRGTKPIPLNQIRTPVLAIYGVPATVQQKYPWYSKVAVEQQRQADRRFAVETPILARQRSRFRSEVANSRVVEIAGGRHYVFLTNPKEVVAAIREFSPGAQSESPTRAQIIAAATDVMKAARYATLISIGSDGRPQARIVDPAPPEPDLTIWIATNPLTRKVGEIRHDGRVTLLYFNTALGEYVTVLGTAILVTDSTAKVKHWKSDWAPFYKSGPRGSDYVLIRVKPSRLEVVSPSHKVVSDPKTWLPVSVDLP